MNEIYGHWQVNEHYSNNTVGFVYLITNLTNNKKYVGKKLMKFKTSKKPLKGRVNKRRGTKVSDWKTYTGSNTDLNEDIQKLGIDKFLFQILKWHDNKTSLGYHELKEIVDRNAIFSHDYYNKWVYIRLKTNISK